MSSKSLLLPKEVQGISSRRPLRTGAWHSSIAQERAREVVREDLAHMAPQVLCYQGASKESWPCGRCAGEPESPLISHGRLMVMKQEAHAHMNPEVLFCPRA